MNWRRGFLRIWLVFTCLWLALFGTMGFHAWRSAQPTENLISAPDGGVYRVESTRGQSQRAVIAFVLRHIETDPAPAECASSLPPPSCADPVALTMPIRQGPSLWWFAFLTLGGPAIVFGAGAVIAWILRGFDGRGASIRRD